MIRLKLVVVAHLQWGRKETKDVSWRLTWSRIRYEDVGGVMESCVLCGGVTRGGKDTLAEIKM